MLKTFTGSPRFVAVAACGGSGGEICWNQRAMAFSLSLIPGVTAEATISSMLRKLFRPLESHGLITSVWPTFSIRTARLDCQLCSMAPSRLIPQPIGVRQFVAVHRAAVDDDVFVLRLGDLFDVALGDVAGLGLGSPRLQRCVPARGLQQGRRDEG